MKNLVIIISLLLCICFKADAQGNAIDSFVWGNATYINLNIGETVDYNGNSIELLEINNHYNYLRIGKDSVWLKVSRRTLPVNSNGIRIFIADNLPLKGLTKNADSGLQSKDAIICVSNFMEPMLDPYKYSFPISFSDGFLWTMEEDTYLFSYQDKPILNSPCSSIFSGIGFDLQDARGLERHLALAFENSTVVWVKDRIDEAGKEAYVLLESESQKGIYYLYKHLFKRNLEVREGQNLRRGEVIGSVWGDEEWGYLQFSVLKSDTIPSSENSFCNVANFFPQMFELYSGRAFGYNKSFARGRILFGLPASINRNEKNTSAFEDYLGKGWVLGFWNIFDKVASVQKGKSGNARLEKKPFSASGMAITNPDNLYTYEISVPNGTYRIRARVGDLLLSSWQQVLFEGVSAGIYALGSGELTWTGEKVVKVKDSKLSIRILIDETGNKVAGLSEIVYQRVY